MQLRNPKEVTTEDYNEFYKKTFNEYLDPLASSHFTTEVPTTITPLLYPQVPLCNLHVYLDMISPFKILVPKGPFGIILQNSFLFYEFKNMKFVFGALFL